MDVRARIQAIIRERDLAERAISIKAGLSDSWLNKFLSGEIKSMTVDNLAKLAEALEVPLRALLEDEPSHYERVIYLFDRFDERQRKQAILHLEAIGDSDPSGSVSKTSQ